MRLYDRLIAEYGREIDELRQAYHALMAAEAAVREYNRRWISADIDTQWRMESEGAELQERISAARNAFDHLLSELARQVRLAYQISTPFVHVREQGARAFWRKALPELVERRYRWEQHGSH